LGAGAVLQASFRCKFPTNELKKFEELLSEIHISFFHYNPVSGMSTGVFLFMGA
jgi:hypothetical protein